MTHLEATSKRIKRNRTSGSVLYSEIEINDFGKHSKSRVEYPVPKQQIIQKLEDLKPSQIIYINDENRKLEEVVALLQKWIDRGHLKEFIKLQKTDVIFEYVLYFESDVEVEIKFRDDKNE